MTSQSTDSRLKLSILVALIFTISNQVFYYYDKFLFYILFINNYYTLSTFLLFILVVIVSCLFYISRIIKLQLYKNKLIAIFICGIVAANFLLILLNSLSLIYSWISMDSLTKQLIVNSYFGIQVDILHIFISLLVTFGSCILAMFVQHRLVIIGGILLLIGIYTSVLFKAQGYGWAIGLSTWWITIVYFVSRALLISDQKQRMC